MFYTETLDRQAWKSATHPTWHKQIRFYNTHRQQIWQKGEHRSTPYSIQEIPASLIYAFLASEDHRFFEHWGIDLWGITRVVMLKLIYGGRLHGASTITQQVAKMWVGSERSMTRKLKEALLAIQMEWHWSKYQILEIYLNHIYLGQRSYGVVEAAWHYFHKNLSELTLAECALLASIPPRPSVINPRRNIGRSMMARNHVLKRMLQLSLISQKEWKQASQAKITLSPIPLRNDPKLAHYVLTAAAHLKTLEITQGYVELAIDMTQQKQALHSMRKGVTQRKLPTTAQAALVATRHYDGAITALQGSLDFTQSQFNRATQSCRSIASTVKPWIYALALQKGWSSTQRISDAPIAIFDAKNQFVWKPHGQRQSNGIGVRLDQALITSQNLPFIHLTQSLGVQTVFEWLTYLQLKQTQAHLSMALGTACASPIQLNQLYSTVAQAGFISNSHVVTSYQTAQNDRVWDHATPVQHGLSEERILSAMIRQHIQKKPTRLLSSEVSSQMKYVLHQVTQKGTAKDAKKFPWMIAGKTGSSDLYDVWFTGFHSTHSITVWVGSDQEEIPLGRKESGGKTALPIWLDFVYNTAHISPRTLDTLVPLMLSQQHLSFPPTKRIKKVSKKYAKPNKKMSTSSSPAEYEEILEMEGQF